MKLSYNYIRTIGERPIIKSFLAGIPTTVGK
jgi:hypothetical protein